MASKAGQPEANNKLDIEEALDYVDKTLDRTKVLYEQYFLGMQKQPPTQIHTDVERRLRDLQQISIRNTGLRYRFATLQQKFGSYNSYWRRTLKQIENGTYIRNLQKISRKAALTGEAIPEEILAAMPKRMREQVKRDREQALAIARRHKEARGERDDADDGMDVALDDEDAAIIGESPELVRQIPRGGAHTLDDGDGDLDFEAFFASVDKAEDTQENIPAYADPEPAAAPRAAAPAARPAAPPVRPSKPVVQYDLSLEDDEATTFQPPPGPAPRATGPVPVQTRGTGSVPSGPRPAGPQQPRATTQPGAGGPQYPRGATEPDAAPPAPPPRAATPPPRAGTPPPVPQRPSGSFPAVGAQPPQRPSGAIPAQQAQPPQRPSGAIPAQPAQRPSGAIPAQQAQSPQHPSGAIPAQQAQRPSGAIPAQPPQHPSGGLAAQQAQRPSGAIPAQPAQRVEPTRPHSAVTTQRIESPAHAPTQRIETLSSHAQTQRIESVRDLPAASHRTTESVPSLQDAPSPSQPVPVQRATGPVPVQRATGPVPVQRATGPVPVVPPPAGSRMATGPVPVVPPPAGSKMKTGPVPIVPPIGAVPPAQARPIPSVPAVPAIPRPAIPSGGIPRPGGAPAPSQISKPNPIAPGSSTTRQAVPVETMSGPFPRAPAPPARAAAPPVNPRQEAPKVAPPKPQPTTPRPPPGMSDADVNALHATYVKAKQAVGEEAGPGSYGKLLQTINAQAPKIMEQYKAKGVEFTVVVKDNQVVIKAKPKT